MKQNLLGLSLDAAEKLLGYWWVLDNVVGNKYIYNRAPCGVVELYVDRNNIVESVYCNPYAERMFSR